MNVPIIELTRDELLLIMPQAKTRVDRFLPYFNKYMREYGVDTTLRMAHLLAQVAVESGELRYTEEIASGSQYEGRKDLGNTEKGDGIRFKGRGLIQITGRYNYRDISIDTGVDFLNHPQLLQQDEYAVLCVFWYWKKRQLNYYADSDNIMGVTKRINGGYTALSSRQKYLERGKKIFRI